MDAYLQALFAVATDGSEEVRKRVCQALVMLLEVQLEKLLPHMGNVVQYMLMATTDADEQVALEACEFWSAICETQVAKEALGAPRAARRARGYAHALALARMREPWKEHPATLPDQPESVRRPCLYLRSRLLTRPLSRPRHDHDHHCHCRAGAAAAGAGAAQGDGLRGGGPRAPRRQVVMPPLPVSHRSSLLSPRSSLLSPLSSLLSSLISPLLSSLLSYLLSSPLSSRSDDDEAQPDRPEDIKPRFHRGRVAGGGAGAVSAEAEGAEGAEEGDDDDDDDDDDEDDDDDDDDDDEVAEWNLRKCSASGLDILAGTFGEAVLPTLLPLLQERLASPQWEVRESGIPALL